jgi:hypothetical protein
MKNAIRYFIFFSLILTLSSCASDKSLIDGGKSSYEESLTKHTRSGKDYKDFETKLIVSATYKTLDFSYAQIDKLSKELLYDSQKTSLLKIKAERDNELYVDFFVSAYTPDERYADFSKTKDFWKIYLKKGDHELVEAQKVKRISKSSLPEYETLYPYISPWMTCYKVRFSRNDLQKSTGSTDISPPLTLVVAGQLGKLELTFD